MAKKQALPSTPTRTPEVNLKKNPIAGNDGKNAGPTESSSKLATSVRP